MENTIIIITGLNGTGKTTFAKRLHCDMPDSTLISKDIVNEIMSDLLGKKKGDHFSIFVKQLFIDMADFCIQRNDNIIILESPFNTGWLDIFKKLNSENKYNFVTVHVKCHSFEEINNRVNSRLDTKERHPIHFCKEYNPNLRNQYNGTFADDIGNYDSFKDAYINNTYTQICLGKKIEYYTDTDRYDEILDHIRDL